MTVKNSAIEWTGPSWNPWQGCVKKTIEIDGAIKLREECRNCYMYRDKKRYGQKPQIVVRSKPPTFNKPLNVQREVKEGKRTNLQDRLVFTCSWSDWFNPEADEWRPEAWGIVRRCPGLIFQVLTKLPQRALDHLPPFWDEIKGRIWIGASCGYQPAYDEMLPELLKIDAAVRFLSMEPLLGPVDLQWCDWCGRFGRHDCEGGYRWAKTIDQDQVGIDWVIGGGESGPGARATDLEWARSIRDQCAEAGIPFFWKQWGEYAPESQVDESLHPTHKEGLGVLMESGAVMTFDGQTMNWRVGKKAAGRLLDGREWNEMPKVEVAA